KDDDDGSENKISARELAFAAVHLNTEIKKTSLAGVTDMEKKMQALIKAMGPWLTQVKTGASPSKKTAGSRKPDEEDITDIHDHLEQHMNDQIQGNDEPEQELLKCMTELRETISAVDEFESLVRANEDLLALELNAEVMRTGLLRQRPSQLQSLSNSVAGVQSFDVVHDQYVSGVTKSPVGEKRDVDVATQGGGTTEETGGRPTRSIPMASQSEWNDVHAAPGAASAEDAETRKQISVDMLQPIESIGDHGDMIRMRRDNDAPPVKMPSTRMSHPGRGTSAVVQNRASQLVEQLKSQAAAGVESAGGSVFDEHDMEHAFATPAVEAGGLQVSDQGRVGVEKAEGE
ncbi:unnamed protein product, partial [Amoebophrya sp. A120]